MDYLDKAKQSIAQSQQMIRVEENALAQTDAQLAWACALVAQTELLAALLERLDALTAVVIGGDSLLVTLTK